MMQSRFDLDYAVMCILAWLVVSAFMVLSFMALCFIGAIAILMSPP